MVEAVGGAGAAAIPIVQFLQLHVHERGNGGDGGGVVGGGAFKGTARIIGNL
jgi:hypothetical protein